MSPRSPWLIVYLLSNIVAAIIIYNTGELIGDVAGNNLYSKPALIFATILVLLSYAIILKPIFNTFSRISIRGIDYRKSEAHIGEIIGKLLILLQLSFLIFNLSTGVNIAGANTIKTDNPLAIFWALVPVDMLFFVYYGLYRENKLFSPNLVVWVVSYLLRGWAGVFLFIIFFEWCRAVRTHKITLSRTAIASVFILVCYPLLSALKWLIRASAATGMTLEAIINGFGNAFRGLDYFSLIGDGVIHIISRLQVTSIVVEVMRMSDLLQSEFANAKFAPFWKEGLHGIILDRLFAGEKSMPIGVAFTQYGNFNWEFDVGNWNTNIGYVGWFFITPYLIPLYIVYTLFLGFLSFFLLKKIGISKSSEDMLWLAWLVFLLPPWIGAFVGFIYALLVFLFIKLIVSRFPKITLLPR